MFEHDYNFLAGESYKIKVIPFDKITSEVCEYPGLYSWYIRPKPKRENEIIPLLSSLAAQSKLDVKAKGKLRLEYYGTLQKQLKKHKSLDPDFARSLFITVPFPLYIGISKNLHTRLSTHCKKLQDHSLTTDDKILPIDDFPEQIEWDSDDESTYFAARITSLFSHAKINAIDCLYIRVFEYQKEGKSKDLNALQIENIRKKLLAIEDVANSYYNPVFGRK